MKIKYPYIYIYLTDRNKNQNVKIYSVHDDDSLFDCVKLMNEIIKKRKENDW